jgi:hypothetical protein
MLSYAVTTKETKEFVKNFCGANSSEISGSVRGSSEHNIMNYVTMMRGGRKYPMIMTNGGLRH